MEGPAEVLLAKGADAVVSVAQNWTIKAEKVSVYLARWHPIKTIRIAQFASGIGQHCGAERVIEQIGIYCNCRGFVSAECSTPN